jgi:hypothetical protein
LTVAQPDFILRRQVMKLMPACLSLSRLAGLLLVAGRLGALAGPTPATQLEAGDLRLQLQCASNGIVLQRLWDTHAAQDLSAPTALPLFTLSLRPAGATNEVAVVADQGWRQCALVRRGHSLELRWTEPLNPSLSGLSVHATASADRHAHAIRWQLQVKNSSTNWSLWRVEFPRLALADLGTNAALLLPKGPGQLERGAWNRSFRYFGDYPGGWCTMQFMAAYRPTEPTGLYFGAHDPWGGTKNLLAQSEPASRSLHLSVSYPAPNMSVAGNGFALEGEAVWQLLRGDWFDAAMIYRDWAQHHAKWWPRLGREGRSDTPRWMRELNVWALRRGGPEACVPAAKQFHQLLGLPLGLHWYEWQQIPYDNDYPHYFPTKAGFAAGIAELKADGVFTMPYINGRLWDTLDRGAEDFEFSRLAAPSATRQADGSPYTESYESKETNGQPVRLAVMCPATLLWQQTVSNLVLRLLTEYGNNAVYIDQIAAAAPKLCMNPAHGHPLGGGHWWNEGYWNMLDSIRAAKPRETALTSECNAEPFLRWFDGYLTWHWQFDGQVPAFPAIYGGTVQMFGRAYRAGETKDLALRMKAGQQLVFGEQLGWLDPALLKQTDSEPFFCQLAQLRARFSRYFSAGRMLRPPRLTGDVPQVKADWQWSGKWWVTTDGLLTGAWSVPAEKRLLLLFVNVSDQPITAAVQADPKAWGLPARAGHPSVTLSTAAAPASSAGQFAVPITFPVRQAQAWEWRW